MTPITRKENYLNEIVGWGETAPEKPLTPEEFFFAAILGEAVQTPEPLSRYQIYLAKIAGRNISVPKPLTRLELFLAKACGMDIETPTPITREEIFWSNYPVIVDFEVEGIPPLSFKAKAGALKDYRIYGQTSRNLFDVSTITLGCYINDEGQIIQNDDINTSDFIKVYPNTNYTYKGAVIYDANIIRIAYYDQSKNFISRYFTPGNAANGETITTPSNCEYVKLSYDNVITNLMLNTGSTPLPYEPYGESVGDRTGNLVDGEPEQGYYRLINGEINTDPTSDYFHKYVYLPLINCIGDSTYSLTYMCQYINAQVCFCWYNDDEFLNSEFFTGVFMGSGSPITVTAPSKATRVGITISGVDTNPNFPTTISLSDISNIMLNEGSTALPYEPYGYRVPVTVSNGTDTQTIPIYLPEQIKKVGDEAEYIDYVEQKLHRVRKNLLQNTATSQTINGVTFTVNADKSITCNGTATNTIFFAVKFDVVLESGTYVLTGCPLGGGQNTFRLYAQTAGGAIFYMDNGAGAIINYTSKIEVLIAIYSGQVCNNLTFYPMIRKADITDDTYEPYIESTDLDVTLPAISTLAGTNTLTVGTEVQPSNVYIKYEVAR